jgi:hypothetical protein
VKRLIAIAFLFLATVACAYSVSLTYWSGTVNISYFLNYTGTPAFKDIFIDVDQSASTGYPINGIGADYLIENGTLYRYSGVNGGWGWTTVQSVIWTDSNQQATATFAKTLIGNPSAVNLIGSATGDGYTSIITQVVQQPYNAPTLSNAVSPIAYGAKCDGVTDDSAAFQSAINAHDVSVIGGTCVINHTITVPISNRHIECYGATLKQTNGFAGQMFVYGDWGNAYTGDSIVGCNFLGANTVAPQYYNNDNRHWDIPVETTDKVSNFFLAGNTFQQFFGQSMFQTYGATDGGSGDTIEYNTFASCGYYGPVFTAHKNGYIGHNTVTDCAVGVENDNSSQATGNNVLEYNTIAGVYGYGAPDMTSAAYISGGANLSADYTTNIVRNNTVSGSSSRTGNPTRIIIGHSWGVKSAQYSNNTCGTGCYTTP